MMKEHVRVAVIGLGRQGVGIAALLLQQGYRLVGGVDMGDKVGEPLASFIPGSDLQVTVRGSIEELIANDTPQIVVLAAAVSGADVAAQAAKLMSAGINAITLNEDLLVRDSSWADELDRIGQQTGASFLATGVQDTWWIHLPAVLAGGACDIRAIELVANVDVDDVQVVVGHELGLGLTREEAESRLKVLQSAPSIMTDPLIEAAKTLGVTPLEASTIGTFVTSGEDIVWSSAGTTIKAGKVVGLSQKTRLTTREGIEFIGTLTTALVPGRIRAPDKIVIHGTPQISVQLDRFQGVMITNTSVLNRIPDVIAAPGGVLIAGALAPMKYHP